VQSKCLIIWKLNVQVAIDDPITFQDFYESLHEISNEGAPGSSDATVNIVKAWAPKTRRLVFDHMTNTWVYRSTPKWLKNKVIKLAPKIAAGNSELKNMRPISLYEVVQKAWTIIVSKQIHLVWHNNH
jgi:hypothetical protein